MLPFIIFVSFVVGVTSEGLLFRIGDNEAGKAVFFAFVIFMSTTALGLATLTLDYRLHECQSYPPMANDQ